MRYSHEDYDEAIKRAKKAAEELKAEKSLKRYSEMERLVRWPIVSH